MTRIYAQPYDLTATGFAFEAIEEFRLNYDAATNAHGEQVEEFELQFIDGDAIDCALADAWGINQANIEAYLEVVESWADQEKLVFIIAVGEAGYCVDPETVSPQHFDIEIYHNRSMKDLAEDFVVDGLFGDIPDHLAHYIDYEAIARDLAMDYTEITIAGDYLIYRVT